MNLLSKIQSVKVENTVNLPEADKNYCEKTHNQYLENLSELNKWRKSLMSLLQENGNPDFIVYETRYNNNEKSVYENTSKLDTSNPFEGNRFSILYGIKKLDKLEKNSIFIFVRNIFSYFNKTYNLDLPVYDTYWDFELTTDITTDFLITYIQNKIGSFDFTSIGIENLKEEFRKTIWWEDKIKIQKNKLIIGDYIRYGSSWDMSYKFRFDMKHHDIRKALFFFESKNLSFDIDLDFMPNDQYIDFTEIYSWAGLKKLKGIKFFKNGKIEIQFIDENIAQEFYDFFELKRIKKRK